jgi:membrane-anchored protein YejM (alkaline phosphatase superfamily)
MKVEINYNSLFWTGTFLFFLFSILLILKLRGPLAFLVYLQILAGFFMFAGSKIGRTFLGLEES